MTVMELFAYGSQLWFLSWLFWTFIQMQESKTYEKLMEIVDMYMLEQEVKERLAENEKPIEVSFDEL